jgi:hypothetical protein
LTETSGRSGGFSTDGHAQRVSDLESDLAGVDQCRAVSNDADAALTAWGFFFDRFLDYRDEPAAAEPRSLSIELDRLSSIAAPRRAVGLSIHYLGSATALTEPGED